MRHSEEFMLSQTDKTTILCHPLFANVPTEWILDELTTTDGCIVCFKSGEPLPICDHAGLVLSGKATVHTIDPTRKALLRILSKGDVFGLASIFSDEPEISKIYADGACRCVFFSREAISHLLDKSDVFRCNYIGFLSNRIRFLNRKIGYLTAGSAERRLALYLLSFEKEEIELTDSIIALSDLLNLGRASLYRAFDKLCEDGYLLKSGKKLTVLNAEAMLNAYQ